MIHTFSTTATEIDNYNYSKLGEYNLLDIYEPLLTNKQKEIMEMYYIYDLSLAEIAELNNTSRQAIHDLIKRCYKQILSYEDKLNLLKKSLEKESVIEALLNDMKKKYSIEEKDLEEYKDILFNL